MNDVRSIVLISAIVGIILPFILRSPKIESKDGSIKIQIGKVILVIFMIAFLFFTVIAVASFMAFVKGDEGSSLIVSIMFLVFGLLTGFCIKIAATKKYILSDNQITAIGIWGKKETFKISDIEKAKLISSDGIRIITRDGKKYLALQLMSNYDALISTLNKNKVLIVNKKKKKMDIGW